MPMPVFVVVSILVLSRIFLSTTTAKALDYCAISGGIQFLHHREYMTATFSTSFSIMTLASNDVQQKQTIARRSKKEQDARKDFDTRRSRGEEARASQKKRESFERRKGLSYSHHHHLIYSYQSLLSSIRATWNRPCHADSTSLIKSLLCVRFCSYLVTWGYYSCAPLQQ